MMLNFYLYSVTSVTLATAYVAGLLLVNGCLRWLFGVDSSYASRETIANGLGFVLVAAPLWMLHWRWLQRQFSIEVEPTAGAVTAYRFYLFTVVCLNAMAVMVAGSIGATGLMRLLLGVGTQGYGTAVMVGTSLAACGLSAWLWGHHWARLRAHPVQQISPVSANWQ